MAITQNPTTYHKPTLVLGANDNPSRVVFTALKMLRSKRVDVFALGLEGGKVGDVEIKNRLEDLKVPPLDTITMYLRAAHQVGYHDLILNQWKPKRIIFNPGAENPELQRLAEAQGIECVNGCTLVMLSLGQY